VPTELITGLFGLAGGLIAVAGTLLGARMNTSTQRLQLAEGRDERQNDVRREACTAFLIGASTILDLAREMARALADQKSADELAGLHERYVSEWRALAGSTAAVQVVGPAEVANAAAELRLAVGGVCDVVDAWLQAHLNGGTNARWKNYNQAKDNADSSMISFVEAAQDWWRDPYSVGKRAA
jgi:hypothetical protein